MAIDIWTEISPFIGYGANVATIGTVLILIRRNSMKRAEGGGVKKEQTRIMEKDIQDLKASHACMESDVKEVGKSVARVEGIVSEVSSTVKLIASSLMSGK